MNSVREIQRLNKLELEQGVSPEASWHNDYRDTAYVYVGGLSFELTEGDIVTIFSQYGEPTFVKLARDKTTGKSRGFGWVKYEDQRSCDLAVDNLGGAKILGRIIRVDHTRYKKRDDEEDDEANYLSQAALSVPAKGNSSDAKSSQPRRARLPEELELERLMIDHDDEDPMKQYYIDEKKKEVEKALDKLQQQKKSHDRRDNSRERRHRRNRSRSRDAETSHRRQRYQRDSRERSTEWRRSYHDTKRARRRSPSEDSYGRSNRRNSREGRHVGHRDHSLSQRRERSSSAEADKRYRNRRHS